MPKMDGAGFLEELERLESPKDIRVVLISGRSESRPQSRFVIGDLRKPFEVDLLLALLDGCPGRD